MLHGMKYAAAPIKEAFYAVCPAAAQLWKVDGKETGDGEERQREGSQGQSMGLDERPSGGETVLLLQLR